MCPFFHALNTYAGQTWQLWKIDICYCSDKMRIFLSNSFAIAILSWWDHTVSIHPNQSSTLVGKYNCILNIMTGFCCPQYVTHMAHLDSHRPKVIADCTGIIHIIKKSCCPQHTMNLTILIGISSWFPCLRNESFGNPQMSLLSTFLHGVK
jgi:hypothetical protein